MKKKRNFQFIFSLLVVFFCSGLLGSAIKIPVTYALEITPENIILLVNQSRQSEGIKPLTENVLLSQAASEKAADMINNNYFAHFSPNGKSPWFWLEKNGCFYEYAGENLAINFFDAVSQHNAWMESEKHRRNILNPAYQEIGVAVKKGNIKGKMSLVVVQFFATPIKKENSAPSTVLNANISKTISGENFPFARQTSLIQTNNFDNLIGLIFTNIKHQLSVFAWIVSLTVFLLTLLWEINFITHRHWKKERHLKIKVL